MEDALAAEAADKPREKLMKMADRAHVNLPNRKPPWWSTAEYGIPMNYGQKAPQPTPGGRKLLTVDEVSGKEETALVKHAPGTVDLAKKAKKELAMLEEERRIDPNKLIELEKKLRDEVARHTPYHERKQTILVRAFQTFDHEKKGTLPLDAFRRALQCFNVEVTPAEGRALFRKFGQDGQRRLPYQVFTNALFTTKSRLLAWTNVHYMNTRGKNGLPKGGERRRDSRTRTTVAAHTTPSLLSLTHTTHVSLLLFLLPRSALHRLRQQGAESRRPPLRREDPAIQCRPRTLRHRLIPSNELGDRYMGDERQGAPGRPRETPARLRDQPGPRLRI